MLVSSESATTPAEAMDPVFGRFKAHKRLSGDQVPLEFVTTHFSTTYTEKGAKRVEVKTPSDSLRNRYCTGHLCFGKRPWDKQPKLVLVFRGTGRAQLLVT